MEREEKAYQDTALEKRPPPFPSPVKGEGIIG